MACGGVDSGNTGYAWTGARESCAVGGWPGVAFRPIRIRAEISGSIGVIEVVTDQLGHLSGNAGSPPLAEAARLRKHIIRVRNAQVFRSPGHLSTADIGDPLDDRAIIRPRNDDITTLHMP